MNFSASIRFGSEILSNIEEQTAECNSFKQTKILLTLVRLKGYFFKDVSIRLGDLEGVIFISINIFIMFWTCYWTKQMTEPPSILKCQILQTLSLERWNSILRALMAGVRRRGNDSNMKLDESLGCKFCNF